MKTNKEYIAESQIKINNIIAAQVIATIARLYDKYRYVLGVIQ